MDVAIRFLTERTGQFLREVVVSYFIAAIAVQKEGFVPDPIDDLLELSIGGSKSLVGQ